MNPFIYYSNDDIKIYLAGGIDNSSINVNFLRFIKNKIENKPNWSIQFNGLGEYSKIALDPQTGDVCIDFSPIGLYNLDDTLRKIEDVKRILAAMSKIPIEILT